MLLKIPITLVMKVVGPVIVHVTAVAPTSSTSVKRMTLWALKGFRNCRSMVAAPGASASSTSMRPDPAFLFPLHS